MLAVMTPLQCYGCHAPANITLALTLSNIMLALTPLLQCYGGHEVPSVLC